MKKLKLVLGVQSDLPLGTTDEQFEHAYQYSFKPFLTVLYKYPKVRTAMHFSGVLLEWFEDKHPEYMMLINEMVKRRQVELIGGGFYSPVFPVIPSKDRVGQIELLTTFIRRKFGKRPRGCWITEGVWEPALASTIKSSGMEYIFLDDVYFLQSGLDKSELYTPFVTDDQGKSVFVLPLHNEFIESAFGTDPQKYIDTIAAVRDTSGKEEQIVSVIWNGNYFGSAYDRYGEIFSEKGWLESFFQLLSNNGHQIQTILPGKYLRVGGPFRRIYFPGSLNISTPAKDYKEGKSTKEGSEIQPGLSTATGRREINNYFRKNIIHFPESGRLYSKMMYVHFIVGQVRRDRSRKKTAKEESWKGQGHVPFWHGPSGGIYDNRIRKAAYSKLIEAEKNTREKGIFSTTVNITDIDLDGADEYLYQGQFINAYVHKRGGCVFELDYVVTSWNYQDVMARYREPYHDREDEKYGFDTSPRSSFVDHLFSKEYSLKEYLSHKAVEKCDFAGSVYYPKKVDKERKDLELDIHRWIDGVNNGDAGAWLHMQKHYDFQKNSIYVNYSFKSEKEKRINGVFATELNLSFPETDNDRLVYTVTRDDKTSAEVFDGKLDLKSVSELSIHDKENRTLITLTPSQAAGLWTYPVYTTTLRYGKKVRIYQGSCYMFLWKCTVGENKSADEYFDRGITLRIEKR
ncbi:MAG: alpha-amylase/4-alpha-glucanotransferase domain-containing protein [Spirochaetaceae bacterium]